MGSKEERMERIVIATDGSPGARAAVAQGLELARQLGASVTFVAVRPGAPLFGDPELIRHLCDELRETRAALDGALDAAESLGVDADFEIPVGPVAEEIVRAAEYRDAGLIVVGSRGLGGDRPGAPLGSVSQELVEISPLPVFVVKQTRADAQRIELAGEIAAV
jgi:nucleotide-binding universal stress UspA family protein